MKVSKKMVACAIGAMIATNSFALTHNLTFPWGDPPRCSPPQTPLMSFHNKENNTMLFSKGLLKNNSKIEIYCQASVRSYGLTWTLHRNCFKTPFTEIAEAEAVPGNMFKIIIDTANLEPGFYDINVKLKCGFDEIKLFDREKTVKTTGICTFGWEVDDMFIPEACPEDFAEFWKKTLDEYNKIPLDVRIEGERKVFNSKEIDEYNMKSGALPGNFFPEHVKYDEVVSYKISWAGPDGKRVYGWVAHPNVENKKFPGMAVFPGAGHFDRPRPLDHARHGYCALDINIHGVDVEAQAKPELAPPKEQPKPRKKFNEMTPQDLDWFFIYQRAYKAIEVLANMKEVDATKIVTVGGSQGGRLSYVVPSLDKRVVATIPCIAHGANMPHFGWMWGMNGQHKHGKGEEVVYKNTHGDKLQGYYDPMNFSPNVKCPILANGGLIDNVSPAFAVWSVFNRAGSKNKKIIPIPGHGHDWSAAFDKIAYRWLDEILGNK